MGLATEWWVITEDGERVAGPFPTAKEAGETRRQIEEKEEFKFINLWVSQAESET